MAIVGLVAVAVALAYFLLVVTPTQEPAPGGTYVEGVVVDSTAPLTLNPLYASSNTFSQDATTLLFSGLTRSVSNKTTSDPGQVIEGDLADRWTVSPDAKTWEFHLRYDARWQDGTPVTARDVLYTVNMLKNPDAAVDRDLGTLWKQVEVSRLGDYTVRFQLEQPAPYFLNYTTVGILPAHKLDGKVKAADLGSPSLEFNRAPVGNGPYQLAPGGLASDSLTLIANPLYYGKKPYLDKIWFRFYPSGNAALSALQANQIDGVSKITADESKRLDALKNVTEFKAPLSRSTFLFLNLQRTGLFGQKEVRQALAYAINRPDLADKALSGQVLPSYSPILPTSWAYKADVKQYQYDPAKARKMLDDAGWKVLRNGVRERNGQPLVFKILVDGSPEKQAVADQLADNLKAIDVFVSKDTAPSVKDLSTALSSSNYDAVLFTTQGYFNDPDPYTSWHSSYAKAGNDHLNYSNWQSEASDLLLEKARGTVQQAARRDFYNQWQSLWADELPGIPLYYDTYNYLVSNRVYGVDQKDFKVINRPSDRLMDISSRYIFFSTKFSS